jgi:hypothetical protein
VDDCEVCLTPTVDAVGMTFHGDGRSDALGTPGIDTVDVTICRECLGLIYEVMVERYRRAVTDTNAVVEQVIKMFGGPTDEPR